MISFRARIIRLLTRQMFKKISPDDDIPTLRHKWERLESRSRPARGTELRPATLAGVDCEWVVPKGHGDAPVLLYLHGGAYIMGSSRTHRTMVSFLAREAGLRAVIPNYRLAPEHRFPAGLGDCVGVYRDLIAKEVPPENVVVAGDSAGGGMTMATLLSLREAGDPLPAAACLLSPWLDLAAEGESIETRAEHDPWFKPKDMPKVVAHYCDTDTIRNPLVSPVYADVRGLPPILVQVGDHEILLSDATRIADKIKEASGEVTLQIWEDMWHVFQYFVGRMPESMRAIRDIATFFQRHLGRAGDADRATKAA